MSHPIPFTLIDRADRVRIDHGNIESLAGDIFTNGLIHPICITPDNQLIAGGRRSKALEYILANFTTMCDNVDLGLPHPDIIRLCDSGMLEFGIHYTHKTVTDIGNLAELELIENVQRHNFSWQEEVQAIARIHQIRVSQKAVERSSWTQNQTGRLIGKTRANVSYCIALSAHLKDETSPIWKCSGIVEALAYLTKLQHDRASVMLAEQVKARASTIPINATPSASSAAELATFVQKFDPSVFQSGSDIQSPSDEFGPVKTTDSNTAAKLMETASIIDANQKLIEESMQVATKIVHHMDCLEFFKLLGPESVDHVVTDPPYGIEMSNIAQSGQGQQDIDRIAETHDVTQNMASFGDWLQGCYTILKPKGFCIWFCDQAQWQLLYDLATAVGFKVQRWPFVWAKTSSCMNQRAEYNFTKATEVAMIMRKGDARLTKAQSVNWWAGGLTPEDKAAGVNHPFIKPQALWDVLLKAVALPGSTIAEPFSGVGSGTRAMLLAGYMPVTCEKNAAHYAQQVNNVAKVYCELNGVNFK
jgi:DNA modification methylase/ParB-like chromosome segregation protein Spo0J